MYKYITGWESEDLQFKLLFLVGPLLFPKFGSGPAPHYYLSTLCVCDMTKDKGNLGKPFPSRHSCEIQERGLCRYIFWLARPLYRE